MNIICELEPVRFKIVTISPSLAQKSRRNRQVAPLTAQLPFMQRGSSNASDPAAATGSRGINPPVADSDPRGNANALNPIPPQHPQPEVTGEPSDAHARGLIEHGIHRDYQPHGRPEAGQQPQETDTDTEEGVKHTPRCSGL